MKRCLLCGQIEDAKTCSKCGEATWGQEMKAALPVAAAAVEPAPEPFQVSFVNRAEEPPKKRGPGRPRKIDSDAK